MSKKMKIGKKSAILYWIAGIVIVVPLLLFLYIYLGAKESSGKPIVGNRFDNSLNPAITNKELDSLKSSLTFEGADAVEINLISATLRINIDAKDDIKEAQVKSIVEDAYEKVNKILPIDTYFTNNKSEKMYDLEVHVYNYIPDDKKPAEKQIYMIKTKTAAAKNPNISIPSSPKNKEIAEKLLKEQEQAKNDKK